MDLCKEATRWKTTVSAIPSVHAAELLLVAKIGIPGESISHTTTCGHDAYSGEEKADKREPGSKVSASLSSIQGECETSHK